VRAAGPSAQRRSRGRSAGGSVLIGLAIAGE
jgi:hypothetical protein